LAGRELATDPLLASWLSDSSLRCWNNGRTRFIASPQAVACALPSEARGLVLSHGEGGDLELWAAQAVLERGAAAQIVTHDQAVTLWSGGTVELAGVEELARTAEGTPLGVLAGPATARRLSLPSRMRRAALR
ncbi:MAG TPA: hypothetical protein VHX44_05295, partial [Planctomycetota bacterium]|nr:hypothetical protein [Planctomycetota bacterium]